MVRPGTARPGSEPCWSPGLSARPGACKAGHVRFHPDWAKHPSARYASMSRRHVPGASWLAGRSTFTRVAEAPGVATPLRLPAGVGGVLYRTEAPAHLRDASPYDIFDCRLVLALSDFSRVLRAHDVDEVLLFRPTARRGGDVAGAARGTRHAGGLAIDARRFGKRDTAGRHVWLDVERDFHGRIGAPACGTGAARPSPPTSEARELRSIACEAADQHLFTVDLDAELRPRAPEPLSHGGDAGGPVVPRPLSSCSLPIGGRTTARLAVPLEHALEDHHAPPPCFDDAAAPGAPGCRRRCWRSWSSPSRAAPGSSTTTPTCAGSCSHTSGRAGSARSC